MLLLSCLSDDVCGCTHPHAPATTFDLPAPFQHRSSTVPARRSKAQAQAVHHHATTSTLVRLWAREEGCGARAGSLVGPLLVSHRPRTPATALELVRVQACGERPASAAVGLSSSRRHPAGAAGVGPSHTTVSSSHTTVSSSHTTVSSSHTTVSSSHTTVSSSHATLQLPSSVALTPHCPRAWHSRHATLEHAQPLRRPLR